MSFNIGDLVSRNSYNNDLIFKIIDINGDIVVLEGVNIRLSADSNVDDLKLESSKDIIDDNNILDRTINSFNLDRDNYFYLPGKVLHIDGDKGYLNRCLNLYEKLNIMAYGITINEEDISKNIDKYLEELNPDILVITGHDAFYKKKGDKNDLDNYKNSSCFVDAVKVARNYEKSHNKLVIIAGACQSDYEELIKSGATFASSPKRVNIHALDPAIIASSVALSDQSKSFDLINIIKKTKYGSDGIGGVITNGSMYIGYPR